MAERIIRPLLGEKMTENEKKNNEKKMLSFNFGISGFFNRFRPSKPKKAEQEEKQKTGEKKKENRQ